MFFDGNFYWLLNGILLVLVAAAFKAFADDRGWTLNWWKGLLALAWYVIFSMWFYAFGTLIGENETSAGVKIFLFGLVVSTVLGVGLVRLISYKAKPAGAAK